MTSVTCLMVNSSKSSGVRWRLARERATGNGFYKCLKKFLPNIHGLRLGGAHRLHYLLSCAFVGVIAFCPGFALEKLLQDDWTANVGHLGVFSFPETLVVQPLPSYFLVRCDETRVNSPGRSSEKGKTGLPYVILGCYNFCIQTEACCTFCSSRE